MPLDPLPSTPPSTADPDNFDERMDDLLAALPDFIEQANDLEENVNTKEAATVAAAAQAIAAAAAALGVTDLMRRSTDNLTIGTGAKNITDLNLPSAAAFADEDEVAIISAANGEILMWGEASACNMPAGTMTVTVDAGNFSGSGTYDNWIIIHRDLAPLQRATADDVREGTSDAKGATPASLMAAGAFVALTYGATVNWDMDDGWNRHLVLGGNCTLAAPTHVHDGMSIALGIEQTATAPDTIVWNSIFDWGADGAPDLSTTNGKVDFAYGQYSAITGKFRMTFSRAA